MRAGGASDSSRVSALPPASEHSLMLYSWTLSLLYIFRGASGCVAVARSARPVSDALSEVSVNMAYKCR